MSVFATNPRAHFDYQILETYEAGIVLSGYEVKAVKSSKVSLRGAYVKIINNEPVLIGALISPYQANNVPADYDTQRTRKLLLKKKEVEHLFNKTVEMGATLVPLKLFGKNGLIKLEIGLARGKKKYDKRETIKKRDVEKKIRRAVK
ncbi:MAG: SsrA-binding protein SmpB [bacterium]|nr:SsrA-binding protein SmpB [bacterium]